VIDHSDRVYSVFLSPHSPIPRFRPGQFLHLALDPYDPGDFWPESRVFSIASSPRERSALRITYAVKGQFTSRMEAELHAGREVWVKLPYGEFTINPGRDVCLLAGGTGITAFTAFLEDLRDDYERDVQLFYGARRPQLLIFQGMAERVRLRCPRFRAWYFAEEGSEGGEMIAGRINLDHVWAQLHEPLSASYYLAGPPQMLLTMKQDLACRGVRAGNILMLGTDCGAMDSLPRCLITGATGFIGSSLVSLLLGKGCQLAVLLRPSSNPWRIQQHLPSLHIIQADLSETFMLNSAIRDFQPDALIHAGWQGVSKMYRDDLSQFQNMDNSLHLFDSCIDSGCELLIGIGSQAEYGETGSILVEDMPANPDTAYGRAKLDTGLQGLKKCSAQGVRYAWLRLTAAYGPMDDPSHLIPQVITTLLGGKTPPLTTGRQRWDYLYIDDIAAAVWAVMQNVQGQGIFNLSSGEAVLVRRICQMIRDDIDPGLSLGFGQLPYPAGSRMVLQARNRLLRRATGWKPRVSLADGLQKTIEWHSRCLSEVQG
jgi:nucleoside-diphosphate-sugar epimerase/ferredoxin-NADP reductase